MAASQEIARDAWREYFDEFSRSAPASEVTLEVAGADVGDQIAAERLALDGITYDDKDDLIVVALNAPGAPREDYEHFIQSPQQVEVATLDNGETTIQVKDAEGRQHLVHVRAAQALPPA